MEKKRARVVSPLFRRSLDRVCWNFYSGVNEDAMHDQTGVTMQDYVIAEVHELLSLLFRALFSRAQNSIASSSDYHS